MRTESGAAAPAKELVSLTDTADLYATATGLMERSAAAYASGVPEDTGDDGFFGPASVTWRMSADLASPVAGLRSLLMQALHPLAMAGVDQHSGWRRDPVGRLAATMTYLATVTFGDRAAARQAAARVRRIHDHVRGTDAVTGRPYAAGDPALLLWVHGALVDSVLAAGSLIGTPLSAADSDRYVAEMVTAAELTGVPRLLVPSNVPELDLYIASVRPTLRCTPAAAESMAYLLDPPGMDEESRGDLAGRPRRRDRRAPALGPADVRLRRAAAPDTRPPDRNPAVARRPRRHVPRSARRARGTATDHPADACSPAGNLLPVLVDRLTLVRGRPAGGRPGPAPTAG